MIKLSSVFYHCNAITVMFTVHIFVFSRIDTCCYVDASVYSVTSTLRSRAVLLRGWRQQDSGSWRGGSPLSRMSLCRHQDIGHECGSDAFAGMYSLDRWRALVIAPQCCLVSKKIGHASLYCRLQFGGAFVVLYMYLQCLRWQLTVGNDVWVLYVL